MKDPIEKIVRADLEKIAWRHYNPEASINVEEMFDEMMPIISKAAQTIEDNLLEEMILAARCQCESHESKEEAEMCGTRTAEFRTLLQNRKNNKE